MDLKLAKVFLGENSNLLVPPTKAFTYPNLNILCPQEKLFCVGMCGILDLCEEGSVVVGSLSYKAGRWLPGAVMRRCAHRRLADMASLASASAVPHHGFSARAVLLTSDMPVQLKNFGHAPCLGNLQCMWAQRHDSTLVFSPISIYTQTSCRHCLAGSMLQATR